MRVLRWVPIGILALLLAVIGFRYGVIRQGMSESDVITLYAQIYLADHAGSSAAGRASSSDCSARPAPAVWTWLVVRCQPQDTGGDATFTYRVNWLGGLIDASGPGRGRQETGPAEPQT